MQKKIAMKFFGSEMTPPPFGNFPEIHSNPGTQASLIIEDLFDMKRALETSLVKTAAAKPSLFTFIYTLFINCLCFKLYRAL